MIAFVRVGSYGGFPDGEPWIEEMNPADADDAQTIAQYRDGGQYIDVGLPDERWSELTGWAHEYASVEAALVDYPDASVQRWHAPDALQPKPA